MNSHEAYTKYIAPQGYTVRGMSADDFEFSASNQTQFPPEGDAKVSVFFRKLKTTNAIHNFTRAVYVMAADSGIDDDFLGFIHDLRKLGMSFQAPQLGPVKKLLCRHV